MIVILYFLLVVNIGCGLQTLDSIFNDRDMQDPIAAWAFGLTCLLTPISVVWLGQL